MGASIEKEKKGKAVEDYTERGVRRRMQGGGDAWAHWHRENVPIQCWMTDFDCVVGTVYFARNYEDALFAEIAGDPHPEKLRREFAVVAVFERKATEEAAFSPKAVVSCAFQLHFCRVYANWQPSKFPPRFFFVIGGDSAPWTMIELDIWTGERVGVPLKIKNGNGEQIWRSLGLLDLRKDLDEWLTCL